MAPENWLIAPLLIAAVLTITYTWTSLRYWVYARSKTGDATRYRPVPIPFTIPWLGHALSFLTPSPGRFFFALLSLTPRERGACELILAGQRTYILFSHTAVQALFKVNHDVANRESFHKTFLLSGTGMSCEDHDKMSATDKDKFEGDLHLAFLLKQSTVIELTEAFARFFKDELEAAKTPLKEEQGKEISLYAWLRPMMMRASVTAFMGQHIISIYPQIAEDFLEYDKGILDLVFRVPRIFKPKAYAAQEQMLKGFVNWIQEVDKKTNNCKPDPQDPNEDWEPHWGSRYSRARQALWIEREMSQAGRASAELGFVFGLNSNAIPATAWMLMHILDPQRPHLLPQVLREVRGSLLPATEGSEPRATLSVRRLVTSPLLQSIFHEVLRMYVDVIVAREIKQDLELPLDAQDKSQGSLLLKKDSVLIAPSIPNHYDQTFFKDPPADQFYAERFLVPESREGEETRYTFSAGDSRMRLWPWGGGKSICPGRVFAKQEVLAAVAMVLLSFQIEAADIDGYKIPGFSACYSGSGTIVPNGDVKVLIRRRSEEIVF